MLPKLNRLHFQAVNLYILIKLSKRHCTVYPDGYLIHCLFVVLLYLINSIGGKQEIDLDKSYSEYMDENIFLLLQAKHTAATLIQGKENGLIEGYRNYFRSVFCSSNH